MADPSNTARPAGHAIPAGCRTSLTADKTPGTQPAGARALLPVQTSGFTAAKEKPVEETEQEEEGGEGGIQDSFFIVVVKDLQSAQTNKLLPLISRSFSLLLIQTAAQLQKTNLALQQQHVPVEVALFFVRELHFSLQNSL